MAAGKKKKKGQKRTTGGKFMTWALSHPLIILSLLVVLVYGISVTYGYTKLDDTIFIQDYQAYNEDPANLVTSFARGVFHETEDTYYRPLFLNSMILNNALSGQNVSGYHLVNILLHLGVVLLLFLFLQRLHIGKPESLLLTAIFAVHPVLTQNVVWIPGRNDTLLAIFVLLFLNKSIDFVRNSRGRDLLLSFIWLLGAFFTKETAVFAPVAAFLVIWLVLKSPVFTKSRWIQYASWVLGFVIWYVMRTIATIVPSELQGGELWSGFIERLPVLIQYLGKVFLPVNLSVFPIMEDTVFYYGFAAIAILAVLLFFSKDKDWKIVAAGFLIFFSFLVPVFLVPKEINTQTFEHRLYLPMIGMLLVLSQCLPLKSNVDSRRLMIGGGLLIILLAVLNLQHQRHFRDELSFWKQAVDTSPNSAYALMMYGAKLPNPDDGAALFRKAYKIDSTEKYLNYYYGAMLQYQDSILESEPYLLKEKARSDYFEVDYMLARVAVEKGDLESGISYLESFLKRSPLHELGNTNLLQLYMQTGNLEKAKTQAIAMQQKGMPLPDETRQKLGL